MTRRIFVQHGVKSWITQRTRRLAKTADLSSSARAACFWRRGLVHEKSSKTLGADGRTCLDGCGVVLT